MRLDLPHEDPDGDLDGVEAPVARLGLDQVDVRVQRGLVWVVSTRWELRLPHAAGAYNQARAIRE